MQPTQPIRKCPQTYPHPLVLHPVTQIYFQPYCQNISIQLRDSICRLSNTCIFVLFGGVLMYSQVAFICSTCRRRTGNFKSPQQARLAKILTYRFLFSLLIVNSNVLHVETKKREMSFLQETVRACGCIRESYPHRTCRFGYYSSVWDTPPFIFRGSSTSGHRRFS